MLRGNHRQALFSTPADRLELNAIVAEVIERSAARVHAFCWMTNVLMAQTLYASERSLLDDTHPQDSRVLGNDRFLAQLPVAQFTPKSTLTLEQMAAQVCRAHNIDLKVIRSPSRRRALTPVRIEIVRRAIQERIATLREVAEYLHRDPSSLSELVLRHQA